MGDQDSPGLDLSVTSKQAWEAPAIRSLETPEINGGSSIGVPEAHHTNVTTAGYES